MSLRPVRAALTIAFALGLLCGLGEGLGLWATQEFVGSRWKTVLSAGPEVMWVAPLLDALLFTVFAALVVGAARLARRPPPLALLTGACAAGLAVDWARFTDEIARRHALMIGAAVGLVAWLGTRGRERQVARAAGVGARVLAAIALLVFAGLTGGMRLRERIVVDRLPPAPPDAFDVLVIVLDTVRSDHLSAYGYARRTTPELERIAAEGVRFDACFSTSSWTLPSHASMLTGRLTWEHGAALDALDGLFPVLGEELLAQGWRTGAFSANLCYFQRRFGFRRGFLCFEDFGWSWFSRFTGTLVGRELFDMAGGEVRESVLRKPAHAVTDAFLDWLDRRPDRPSFAFLNWYDAHDPYLPPPPFAGRFGGDGITAGDPPPPQPGETRPWTREQLDRHHQAYDECILLLDTELGRLRAELERRGRFERTILAVVGDHGEAFGERGARLHRGSLHREQVQVPLVMRAPGRIPAGSVVERVTSVASLPATLVDLLRLPIEVFPGPSLAECWRDDGDEAGDEDGVALLELAHHPWNEYRRRECFDGALRSIVRGRWHYVWHEKRGRRLYDRIADPREERDVLAEHPDVAAALEQELDAALAGLQRHPLEPTGVMPGERARLAGVGYIGDEHGDDR